MSQLILLNEMEAARFLGLRTKTLASWRCRGTGPVFRKIGRLVRYMQSDLEEYLENQARRSTAENPTSHLQNRKPINGR